MVYEVNFGRYGSLSLPSVVGFYLAAFAITSYFAVWTATSLRLPSFLLLSPLTWRRRGLRFLLYGVGMGLAIYGVNRILYAGTVSNPLRPWYLANLEGPADLLLLSARSALLEETLFRLFAIPFLVSLGMRVGYGWRPRFGFESPGEERADSMVPPRVLVVTAVLLSALFFSLAHPFNPLPALVFGLVLGVVYLRGGWESAVTAHFLGNYLLFSGLYLR